MIARSRSRRIALVSAGIVVLALTLGVGIVPRMTRRPEPRAAARSTEMAVIAASRSPAVADLALPGNLQDGQVLGEIDAVALDQELAEARATQVRLVAALAQARADLQEARETLEQNRSTLESSRITLSRWRTLNEQGLVARRDVDDRKNIYDSSVAGLDAARANVEAREAGVAAADANVMENEANVRRLVDLQLARKVRAPLSGSDGQEPHFGQPAQPLGRRAR